MKNEVFRVLKKEELAQVAGGIAAATGATQNQCDKDGKNDLACVGSAARSVKR